MASPQQDLLHVLAREHRDLSVAFHGLMDQLHDTPQRHRRRRFGSLVLNLGVHLSAERLMVHPMAVRASDRGEALVGEREQEIAAFRGYLTEVGAALDDASRLATALRSTSAAFTAHADREELEVFLYARHVTTPKQLRRIGRLHVTQHQRLPVRYQREGAFASQPWADPSLFDTLHRWYADQVDDPERWMLVSPGPQNSEAGDGPRHDRR